MAEPNTVTLINNQVRDTVNINTNSLIRDVKRKVTLLEADRAKLIILLNKIGQASTTNPKFEWQEDEYVAENAAINNSGGYNTTATTLVLDDSDMIIVGDILYNARTGELMEVTGNTIATENIVVVRDANNTRVTGVAINDNDVLVVVGNVNEEGATLRQIISTQINQPYNYTQIFRNPIGLTNTQASTDTYHGKDMPYQRRKKLTEHLQEIEKNLLFGKRGIVTTGTHPKRFSGGMAEFITTNVTTDANGTLTEKELDNFLAGVFRFGSRRKVGYAAQIYITAINYWAKDKLRINLDAKKFGLSIFDYMTPHGQLMLMDSEILTRTSTWSEWMFVLDFENLRKRHLQGRNTQLKTNRQANDEDSVKDEYLTECGLERSFEKAHGIYKGVTDYS